MERNRFELANEKEQEKNKPHRLVQNILKHNGQYCSTHPLPTVTQGGLGLARVRKDNSPVCNSDQETNNLQPAKHGRGRKRLASRTIVKEAGEKGGAVLVRVWEKKSVPFFGEKKRWKPDCVKEKKATIIKTR